MDRSSNNGDPSSFNMMNESAAEFTFHGSSGGAAEFRTDQQSSFFGPYNDCQEFSLDQYQDDTVVEDQSFDFPTTECIDELFTQPFEDTFDTPGMLIPEADGGQAGAMATLPCTNSSPVQGDAQIETIDAPRVICHSSPCPLKVSVSKPFPTPIRCETCERLARHVTATAGTSVIQPTSPPTCIAADRKLPSLDYIEDISKLLVSSLDKASTAHKPTHARALSSKRPQDGWEGQVPGDQARIGSEKAIEIPFFTSVSNGDHDFSFNPSDSDRAKVIPYNSVELGDTQTWHTRYEDLLLYRKTFGHCNVSYNEKKFAFLYSWVKRQRYQYKRKMQGQSSHLTDQRVRALEAVGFAWDTRDLAWEAKFEELQNFVKEHGHCRIPAKETCLFAWAKRQRRQYRQWVSKEDSSPLTQGRYLRLTKLGFKFLT